MPEYASRKSESLDEYTERLQLPRLCQTFQCNLLCDEGDKPKRRAGWLDRMIVANNNNIVPRENTEHDAVFYFLFSAAPLPLRHFLHHHPHLFAYLSTA